LKEENPVSAVIGSTIAINIPVGDETVVLVCRRPTTQEQSKFLKDRFEAKGRKVKSHLYETRVALIDKILLDVKNAEYETASGERKPLNNGTSLADEDKRHWSGILGTTVETWRDLIPPSWKSSAAMRFEDPQPEDDEDKGTEGN
jgi:hypothetical protein